jgi:hypothetical protein
LVGKAIFFEAFIVSRLNSGCTIEMVMAEFKDMWSVSEPKMRDYQFKLVLFFLPCG